MSINQKQTGIRWWIFKKFGPPMLQGLVNHINQEMDQAETDAIIIYPLGEFSFSVRTSSDHDLEPIVFPTAQERQSFQSGLDFGVRMMGGSTQAITSEDFEIIEQMTKKTTHGGSGGKMN